jgi:hypothetical protein
LVTLFDFDIDDRYVDVSSLLITDSGGDVSGSILGFGTFLTNVPVLLRFIARCRGVAFGIIFVSSVPEMSATIGMVVVAVVLPSFLWCSTGTVQVTFPVFDSCLLGGVVVVEVVSMI